MERLLNRRGCCPVPADVKNEFSQDVQILIECI
jgi:hypothetical protein